MGYIHNDGRIYGIIPIRKLKDYILLNIPFLNLIYTKKVRISIIKRLDNGAPALGIFTYTKIYKNEKKLKIKFMVPYTFTNVLVTVYDENDNAVFKYKELDKIYYPQIQYTLELK